MKILKFLVRKNRRLSGKFKIESPENVWTDGSILGSKRYPFKFEDDAKNKLGGVLKSHLKFIKVEE